MSDYDRLHDVLWEALDIELTDEQIDRVLELVPSQLAAEGDEWGWDTVTSDELFRWAKKNFNQLVFMFAY
jgi:hypothetical protein